MYYNNERDGKSIYYADSPDLYKWKDSGKKVISDMSGEGPNVFSWKGKNWMIVDNWKGQGVYTSADLLNWTRQEKMILSTPGTGNDDKAFGLHADVLVNGDRAFIIYFTHPARTSNVPDRNGNVSSLQIAELGYEGGQLVCDRDQPVYIKLKAPKNQ
jgi:hypothetical protein